MILFKENENKTADSYDSLFACSSLEQVGIIYEEGQEDGPATSISVVQGAHGQISEFYLSPLQSLREKRQEIERIRLQEKQIRVEMRRLHIARDGLLKRLQQLGVTGDDLNMSTDVWIDLSPPRATSSLHSEKH